MKTLICLILFLTISTLGISQQLPDAPVPQLSHVKESKAVPSNVENEPTENHKKVVIVGLLGGAAVAFTIWYFTHPKKCGNMYEGKPYNGTVDAHGYCPQDEHYGPH